MMRLYEVYKECDGERALVSRCIASSPSDVHVPLPRLEDGERYLDPLEVTDVKLYEQAIRSFERAAEEINNGDTVEELRAVLRSLRCALLEMSSAGLSSH